MWYIHAIHTETAHRGLLARYSGSVPDRNRAPAPARGCRQQLRDLAPAHRDSSTLYHAQDRCSTAHATRHRSPELYSLPALKGKKVEVRLEGNPQRHCVSMIQAGKRQTRHACPVVVAVVRQRSRGGCSYMLALRLGGTERLKSSPYSFE